MIDIRESLRLTESFLQRLGTRDMYIVADIETDQQTSLVLYSNRPLSGYVDEGGLFTKRLELSGDTDSVRMTKGYIAGGAERKIAYAKDGIPLNARFSRDVLSIVADENVEYAFVPTGRAVAWLANDPEYSDFVHKCREKAGTRIMKNDAGSVVVHESLHGPVEGNNNKEDLKRELQERGYDVFDHEVDELFSVLGEMRFIYENCPELASGYEEDIAEQEPYIDNDMWSPYPVASRLYAEIRNDPNLGPFVGFIFGKRE